MKQYTRIALILLIVIAAKGCWACNDDNFAEFKAKHNKTYETEEEETKRRQIFCDHMVKVTEHNERYDRGEESYTLGINEFSDWTQDEVHNRLLGGIKRHHRKLVEE